MFLFGTLWGSPCIFVQWACYPHWVSSLDASVSRSAVFRCVPWGYLVFVYLHTSNWSYHIVKWFGQVIVQHRVSLQDILKVELKSSDLEAVSSLQVGFHGSTADMRIWCFIKCLSAYALECWQCHEWLVSSMSCRWESDALSMSGRNRVVACRCVSAGRSVYLWASTDRGRQRDGRWRGARLAWSHILNV